MRLMVYNIRYGTGGKRRVFPWGGYLGRTTTNLGAIAAFIESHEPDVVGLLEVDGGSYRSGRTNQAAVIAEKMGHCHVYASKYGATHVAQKLPLMSRQGNAFVVKDANRQERFHYFQDGVKRLVIELELEHVTIFLVHLALGFGVRHRQLQTLCDMVRTTRKPCVVAGDFNTLRGGEAELRWFADSAGLTNACDTGEPSFPSWAPKRHLDFVLCGDGVRTTSFSLPNVALSDHLPIVCDFEVDGVQSSG